MIEDQKDLSLFDRFLQELLDSPVHPRRVRRERAEASALSAAQSLRSPHMAHLSKFVKNVAHKTLAKLFPATYDTSPAL